MTSSVENLDALAASSSVAFAALAAFAAVFRPSLLVSVALKFRMYECF